MHPSQCRATAEMKWISAETRAMRQDAASTKSDSFPAARGGGSMGRDFEILEFDGEGRVRRIDGGHADGQFFRELGFKRLDLDPFFAVVAHGNRGVFAAARQLEPGGSAL